MARVSLPDLVNLSFDDCELKNIKFRVLHYSLQVIVHQLNLGNVMVEFKGNESHFIQNEVSRTTEAVKKNIKLAVTSGHQEQFDSSSSHATEKPQDAMAPMRQVVVIENGKITEHGKKARPATAAMTHIEGKTRHMQAQIDHLGAQVLPTNQNVLYKIKDGQEEKPETESFQTMKITTRMSRAEEEIEQIASLLETVKKDYSELRIIMDTIHEEFGQDTNETLHQLKLVSGYIANIRPRDVFYQTLLNRRLISEKTDHEAFQKDENKSLNDHDLYTDSLRISSKTESMGDRQEIQTMNEPITNEIKESEVFLPSILSDNLLNSNEENEMAGDKKKTEGTKSQIKNELLEVITPLSENTQVSVKTINKLAQQLEQLKLDHEFIIVQMNTLSIFSEIILSELTESKPNIEVLKEELREIRLSPSEYKKTKIWKRNVLDIHTEICYRIDSIEGDISKHTGQMILQGEMHEETIDNIIERLETIETELNSAVKDINVLKLYERSDENVKLETLGQKLASLDEHLGVIDMLAQNTSKDIKRHKIILRTLKDDVLALKTVKLDRFELEGLLSDKANVHELNNKVSNNDYTQAYRFLTKCVEKNAQQLSSQTLLWNEIVEKVESALESKLSFEDFDERAKKLETEIIKTMTDIVISTCGKDGPPARGGKQKVIKNLQCISCDQDVIMKKKNDFPNFPMLPRLPGHKIKSRQKDLVKNEHVSPDSVNVKKALDEKNTEIETPVTNHEEF